MKRGDDTSNHRWGYNKFFITAVKIEYFDGKQWKTYNDNGVEWLPTGVQEKDHMNTQHTIKLDPPIDGATKVRLQLDWDHAKNAIFGRFDWVVAEEL